MHAFEFPIKSQGLFPVDSGFSVLGALSVDHPFLHGRRDIQIAPLMGMQRTKGPQLAFGPNTRLHIRGLTMEEASALSGAVLRLQDSLVRVLAPTLVQLQPFSRLVSHQVLFNLRKDTLGPEMFKKRVYACLDKLGDAKGIGVTLGTSTRALRVHGRHLKGYSVVLTDVPAEMSMALLQKGMGTHTSMGCGVFQARPHTP